MSTDMINRIAMAICDDEWNRIPDTKEQAEDEAYHYSSLATPVRTKDEWREAARAALLVLKDPTESMLCEGELALGNSIRVIWEFMIEDALK